MSASTWLIFVLATTSIFLSGWRIGAAFETRGDNSGGYYAPCHESSTFEAKYQTRPNVFNVTCLPLTTLSPEEQAAITKEYVVR